MKIVHVHSMRDTRARERSGYLEMAAILGQIELISMDKVNSTDLVGLRYNPCPRTIYDFIKARSFEGLFTDGADMSGHDLYVIDIPHEAVFDDKPVSSILEAQLMVAAMLLFSREVTAEKIAIISDRPINIGEEIAKLPEDSMLRRVIKLREGHANHPIRTLDQMHIIIAPEKAVDFPGMLGVIKRQPTTIVAAPADVKEMEVVPPEAAPTSYKLAPEGQMADKFSDPDRPFMQIVHVNTLATAPFFRNMNLKHHFGEKNILTVHSPGDEIALGQHDVVVVDYPKYMLTGPDSTKTLDSPEELQVAFVVRFLQMGLDPKRIAVIEMKDSLITCARNDFNVFKRLFSKTALPEGAAAETAEGLVPILDLPDPELERLHKLLQATHPIDAPQEVFQFSEKVAQAFGDKLNFRPRLQKLMQGSIEVETSTPTPPGEGDPKKLQARFTDGFGR